MTGSAGADLLIGSADGVADLYVYDKLTDSGLNNASRGTINGFEDGQDRIDVGERAAVVPGSPLRGAPE